MDPDQPPEAASDNKRGAHGDAPRGALGRYLEGLVERLDLSGFRVQADYASVAQKPLIADGVLRERDVG